MTTNDHSRASTAPEFHPPPTGYGVTTIEALGQRFPLTLSVERAAKIVGISRTAMYEAVRRGDIETISLNGRRAVLTVPLLRRIGIEDADRQDQSL